jgi:hypothetical protein
MKVMDNSGIDQPHEPDLTAYSVTSLCLYEECPWQYFRQHVLGIVPPRTKAMQRGTDVHLLIHQFYAHGRVPLLEEDDFFQTFLSSRFKMEAMLTEKKMHLATPMGEVIGIVDAVLDHGHAYELVDFKCGRLWDAQVTRANLQLPLYALMLHEMLPSEQRKPMFTTYFYLGSDKQVTMEIRDLGRIRERLDHILENIALKHFHRNRRCQCWGCRADRKAGFV